MDNDFATGYALGADSASGDRNNGGFGAVMAGGLSSSLP